MGVAVKSGVAEEEGVIGFIVNPPPGSDKGRTGPTEEDARTAKVVWAYYQAAKRWKESGEFGQAKSNWEYWSDRQWNYQRASHLTMAVMNTVYSTVETFIGHFTDNLPESIARSRNPKQIRVGEMATKLFNWTNDLNNVTSQNELYLRSAAITGFAVQRVDWDRSMDGKRGAPRYTFVDETCFFVSPWTRDPLLSDARYVIEAQNLPVETVRAMFPDRADDIRPGVWDGSLTPDFMAGSGTKGYAEYLTFPSGQGAMSVGPQKGGAESKDLCTLIRCVIRQDDGTLRDIYVANTIVCQDQPIAYNDEAYPYSLYNVMRDKNSAYGHSIVRWMKNLQDNINQLVSFMIDYQRYDSNSPLVVDQANLEEGKYITNAPDSVLVNKSANFPGYQILTKPGANSQFLNIINYVSEALNRQTGNVDILRGEHPASVTTLGAMEILRDEANVLVKKMGIQLLTGMKRRDELCLSRLIQYLKDERTVRVAGQGGQEYITVNQKVSLGIDGTWIVANTIPDDFEADIDLTPMPPGGMQAKFERAMAMITTPAEDGLPIINRDYFLKYVEEDPEMVAELEEQMAQAAEEQAKAAQAQEAAKNGQAPAEEEPMTDDEMRVRSMRVLGGGV